MTNSWFALCQLYLKLQCFLAGFCYLALLQSLEPTELCLSLGALRMLVHHPKNVILRTSQDVLILTLHIIPIIPSPNSVDLPANSRPVKDVQ